MTTVTFDALVPGDDINSRKTGRRDGIEELAANILAQTVLQPLAVRKLDDEHVQIIDGHRRHAAIALLIERGDFGCDIHVPVYYLDKADDMEAREASLAANIARVPLHPVDQFEEFSRLSERYTPEQIADRFGVTERLVRQRVALGSLHLDIRTAWRGGQLRDDAAKAFTLEPDQTRQLKIFKKLQKEHNLYEHSVKAEIGVNHDAAKALKIIGADAYRKAGGSVIEDLFGNDCVVSDPELAKRLLADLLQAECDALAADGWSFAVLIDSVKDRWSWPRLSPTGRSAPTDEETVRLDAIEKEAEAICAASTAEEYTAEEEARLDELNEERDRIKAAIELRRWGPRQKKVAGCFVGVSHRGKIDVTYGVQNPKDVKKAAKEKANKAAAADDGGAEDEKPAISTALALALSEQKTIAASRAIRAYPGIALRVAVAALERTEYGQAPATIKHSGLSALDERALDADIDFVFHEQFSDLLGLTDNEVLSRLADAVARTLDLRTHNPLSKPSEDETALLSAIPTGAYIDAARAVFDAGAYFKGVKTELCHAALDEMGVETKGRPKKKGELAAICVTAAKERGWLPAEIRKPEGSSAI
jgi:ParB family chromosome partitioning protein